MRERVALGALIVKHVRARQQLADIFMKPLIYKVSDELRYKLGVASSPTPSLRGYIGDRTSKSSVLQKAQKGEEKMGHEEKPKQQMQSAGPEFKTIAPQRLCL